MDVVGRRRDSPGGCAARTPRPGSRSPAPTARRPPPRCSPRSCAAAGLRTAAVGNIGTPISTWSSATETYDVLAVELSSYQLHWAPSVRAHSAAVLNLAPDHLDWHGSMEAYAADKGRIYEGNQVACVYNVRRQPATEDLVREADVEEGCRAIGFTLGAPGPSQLGVVDGILVDRAFVENRQQQRPGTGRGRGRQPARPAQHRQRPCRGCPRPRLRGAREGRPGRPAGLHARTRTASRTSPTWTGSPTSTTPRRPTRMRPRPPWRRTSRSSGSPADSPRARPSTNWSPSRQSDFAEWC